MRGILTAFGISAASMAAAEDGFYGKYESPRYEVTGAAGAAELRRYAPQLLAVVAVEGDRSGAMGRGFRVLAGYIFGGNAGQASVAMTSPVTQTSTQIAMTSPVSQSGGAGVWEVTFMMPTDYAIDTLPQPNNPAVRFVERAARDMIVLTFSGRTPARVLEDRVAELRGIVDASGLSVTGDPVYMFYDDPFTAPWARRNEVGFVVE